MTRALRAMTAAYRGKDELTAKNVTPGATCARIKALVIAKQPPK